MPGPRAAHPAALSAAERAQLLAVLDADRFADKSPAQAWAMLLDEGTYLASVSTMYRVLRADGQVRERRAQAAHPPRVRPELVATGPSPGVVVGHHEAERTVAGHLVRPVRDAGHLLPQGDLAGSARHRERGSSPRIHHCRCHRQWRHRARPHPRRPRHVDDLQAGRRLLADLNISRSHSRPHVSNDNPYSEAQFKTLKYCPAFPGSFASLARRPRLLRRLLHLVQQRAPPFRHRPAYPRIRARRHRRPDPGPPGTGPPAGLRRQPWPVPPAPTPPPLPAKVWINQPPATIETEVTPHKN